MRLWQKVLLVGTVPVVSGVYCFLLAADAVGRSGLSILLPTALVLILGSTAGALLLPSNALPPRGRLLRRLLLPAATAAGVLTTPFLIVVYSLSYHIRITESMGATDTVVVALALLVGGGMAGVLLRLLLPAGAPARALFPLTPGICQSVMAAWMTVQDLTPQRHFLEMLNRWLHTDYFVPDWRVLSGPTKLEELSFLVIWIGLSYVGVLLGHKTLGKAVIHFCEYVTSGRRSGGIP